MKRSEEIQRQIDEAEAELEKERREYHERTGGFLLVEVPLELQKALFDAQMDEVLAESEEGKDEGLLSADGADERGLEM